MEVRIIATVAILCLSSGCTMTSLERHTVAQVDTTTELRYREVMNNLAMIANDPSRLPNYTSIFSGTVFVQDTGQLLSTTTWPWAVSLGSQATNPSVNRQISQNWTLDPVLVPEKLEAMRAACQWAIGGPGYVWPDSMSLLVRPDDAPPGPDRHFGVVEQLAQMPAGWLRRFPQRRSEVHPLQSTLRKYVGLGYARGHGGPGGFHARHSEHRQNPDQLINAVQSAPGVHPNRVSDQGRRPERSIQSRLQVVVDQSGHLQTDLPYLPIRVETTGLDSAIRSAISAAGISSVPH